MLYRVVLSFLTVFVTLNNVASKIHDKNANNESGITRLSGKIIPKTYDLFIKTNIHAEEFTFTGLVKTDIDVREKTNVIKLHSKQLNITSAKLWNNQISPPVYSLLEVSFESDELLVLTAQADLQVHDNVYHLEIDYHGVLRDDDLGFYKTSYINNAGKRV